jgi:hypothetical protein
MYGEMHPLLQSKQDRRLAPGRSLTWLPDRQYITETPTARMRRIFNFRADFRRPFNPPLAWR